MSEASRALGVSLDTLRRWDRAGKLRTGRDERNRRRVPRAEVERLAERPRRGGGERGGGRAAPAGDGARGDRPGGLSARNRLSGRVRSVEVDGVMALVELEAGPFRVVAAITRDAVGDLGLEPGVPATATVKATSVMLERDG